MAKATNIELDVKKVELTVKDYIAKFQYQLTPDQINDNLGLGHDPMDELTIVTCCEKTGAVCSSKTLDCAVEAMPVDDADVDSEDDADDEQFLSDGEQ